MWERIRSTNSSSLIPPLLVLSISMSSHSKGNDHPIAPPLSLDAFEDTLAYDDGIPYWIWGGLNNYRLTTRFTPLATFEVQQVLVMLIYENLTTPITLWLKADSTGMPGMILWEGSMIYDSTFTWKSTIIDTTGLYIFPAGDTFWLELFSPGPPFETFDQIPGPPERSYVMFPGSTVWVACPGDNFIRAVGHYVCPDVTVTLMPFSPPIQIPTTGGSFDFNIAVANNSSSSATFDVWCDATLPTGTIVGPLLGPVNVTVPAGFSGDRDRSQNVPGGAPSGSYSYHGYVGIYPDDIWDQDGFTFEKLGTDGSDWGSGWFNTGESFGGKGDSRIAPTGVSETYSLEQNYPNPFNPVTTIRYGLPEDAFVKIAIYDLLGRQVAELVNCWREAGAHEVTFDGSGLASGVYVYRLEVNRASGSGAIPTTARGKMVLMK